MKTSNKKIIYSIWFESGFIWGGHTSLRQAKKHCNDTKETCSIFENGNFENQVCMKLNGKWYPSR